ncbi:hypothetical protein Esti_001691 [Eimeria stiedai]
MAARLPLWGPRFSRCVRGLLKSLEAHNHSAALLQRQQQPQLQQHQLLRHFSRFRRTGSERASPPRQTLNPEPSPTTSDPRPSHQAAEAKLLNREVVLRRSRVSSNESLYEESLEALRRRRWELGDPLEAPSPEIEELSKQEKKIVQSLMERTQQETQVTRQTLKPIPSRTIEGTEFELQESGSNNGIDAFWNPMARVEGLEAQVAHDFEEFTKLVGAAEARRQRLLLRESLRKAAKLHDPLSAARAEYFGEEEGEAPPTPHRQAERFWNPNATSRSALKNKNLPITWKDLHLLHLFVGSNGLLLPRRLTHASRLQQRFIYKAVNSARRMGLFPYDRKPSDACKLPLMDPLQFLVDELTHRAHTQGDLRAEAMLRVLMERYPKLDYFRFLQLQARWRERGRGEEEAEPQKKSEFARLFKP